MPTAPPIAESRCETGLTRRRWVQGALAGGAALVAGTGVYAWWIEPHWVAVRRQPMRFVGLPDRLVGKRLVQISDLHVGPVVDNDYLRRVMRRLASLEPDYLAITGDFMTCIGGLQVELTIQTLHESPLHDVPTIAALGNHDYGENFRNKGYAAALTDALDKEGVHVLRNESVVLDGLQFAGCGDLWARECELKTAFSRIDPLAPAVFLAHNPDIADAPYWGDFRGWILSGHTHGGQCQFPVIGAPILPIRNQRYCEGHIRIAGGRDLYVNRGLGYKRRIRFGVRPEVTLFTLQRA